MYRRAINKNEIDKNIKRLLDKKFKKFKLLYLL